MRGPARRHLQRMKRFRNDALDGALCHGDLLLQFCANTADTNIHALRDIHLTVAKGEFVALMKIADKGYGREQLVGSYAGAFGNPQFLPSVYLRLATDGDGDGRADIFTNRPDTFASIANYFRDAGWRPGQPWGVAAAVPPGFGVSAYRTRLVSPVCPRVHERLSRWMTVREWRAAGIEPLRPLADDVMTAFFQPDGPGTRAWLLTGNYRAILEYNCSSYYALSVGLLADEIVN